MALSRNRSLLQASLIFVALLGGRDSAYGCDGDQYWAEPRRIKTWMLRATVKFMAPNAVVSDEFLRQALSEAQLAPCTFFERDLVGQDVHIEKALRSNALRSPST